MALAVKYREARAALFKLLGPGTWEKELRELSHKDLTTPDGTEISIEDPNDVIGPDGRQVSKKKKLIIERNLGEGYRSVSWIWMRVPVTQYFTLLHEFRRIPPESHGMLEFHWESAGMVGMCHSCGFPWIPSGIPGKFHGNSRMIPMDSQWNSSGISMEIPPKFQNDSKWNLNGIPMSSKFNQCKNRVQYQYILKTYLSGSHMGQVQT